MKQKVIAFVKLAAYVMGAIGGFGYSAWGGSWPIAISVVVLAWMAWPTVVKCWKVLNS